MRVWNSRLKTHVNQPDEEVQRELKRRFYYDQETGYWTYLTSAARKTVGARADRISADGYYVLYFKGKKFRVQTLAYFYMTGTWPAVLIDHRDADRGNNKWKNLRPANKAQNNANSKLRKDNTSGLKGVYWNKDKKCWTASIASMGKVKILHDSPCLAAAHFAYLVEADILYGEFARAR